MKQSTKAVAAVVLSGILWGVISLFVNGLNDAGLDSMEICAVRMAVAALFSLAFLAFCSPGKLKIRPRDLWFFIGTGIVSVALFNALYFRAIVESGASVAAVLLYTSPVFVAVMSAMLFKERLTPRKVLILAGILVGCVLVTGLLEQGSLVMTPAALLCGIGSGFFYALYTIFARFALKRYSSETVSVYTFLMAAIGSMLMRSPVATWQKLVLQPRFLWLALGIGLICSALPYFLYTWGLERMESGKAAGLVAVEPLMGALMGVVVFHENLSLLQILGTLLVLGAIVALGLRDSGETPECPVAKEGSH